MSNSFSGNVHAVGVLVSLTGAATTSTTSGADGTYSIGGLPDGSYVITPTLAGTTFSPTSRNETVAGSDVPGVDFTPTGPYSITGNTTVGGATVSYSSPFTSGTVTCDVTGAYTIPGLTNGTYTLQVSGGTPVTPHTLTVLVNGSNVTGANFARATVSGTIDSFQLDGTGFIKFSPVNLVWFHIRDFNQTGKTFQLTSVAVSAGHAVYTGTITDGDANAFVGLQLTASGFSTAGNDVTFIVTASTATTLTCVATTQVNESAGSAVASNSLPAVGQNVLFNFGPSSSRAINISAS